MKIKERNLLLSLHTALAKVPFPHDGMGMKTASMEGFTAYSEDMHALVPMVQQFLMGLVTVDNLNRYPDMADEYKEGEDYHKPALTLKAIQRWIKVRDSQNWENPNRYGLKRIYESLRKDGIGRCEQ